ncbi:glycosyltransferase [Flavobacteriaceae bacterium Ap0902]|nr:glycosyltransferase [Flavobacteriaceae bacterium Ap0902]
MRIAQVIDQLGTGGAERVCVNLTNLFARNGFEVKLIVFDKIGSFFDLIDTNVEVVVLNKKEGKLKAYRKIVEEVQAYDIIHVHMRQTYRFIQKAFLIFGKRKKVILHDHYGKIGINKKVPLFYKNLFKPTFYIGCTTLLTDWARWKVKMKEEHVFFVNNFVLQQSGSVINYPKRSGLVLVANLKEVKNHRFAISLAHALDKKLTIYCSNASGDYYEELRILLEDLNYSNQVNFITGCHNVQAEFGKYELGLLTSFSEGDPLVIMEYLAQGLPCLVSDVGEAVKVINQHFPWMVQRDFELNNWIKAYPKATDVEPERIKNLYDTHFSEELYLNQYLEIYKIFLTIA